MMETKAIVTSPNIQGDITSCKIEVTRIAETKSALSLTIREEFMTYNTCNKEEIARYQTARLSELGGLSLFIVAAFVVLPFMGYLIGKVLTIKIVD